MFPMRDPPTFDMHHLLIVTSNGAYT